MARPFQGLQRWIEGFAGLSSGAALRGFARCYAPWKGRGHSILRSVNGTSLYHFSRRSAPSAKPLSATRGRDGLDDGFAEAENNARAFRVQIEKLIALDGGNAQRYEAMLPVFDEYYSVGKKMARAYIDEGPAGGNRMMSSFDAVAEKMSEQVDGFLATMKDEIATANSRLSDVEFTTRLAVIFGSIAVLLGIGFIYFIMSRALAYLPVVLTEMQRIAQGDLTSTIEVARQDELGGLMHGLQAMKQHLLEMVSKINQTTERLSTSADELSAVTTQTSENIRLQQSETAQIATSMNQMSTTVREVALNVNSTSAAADEANVETENGRHEVDAAVEGFPSFGRSDRKYGARDQPARAEQRKYQPGSRGHQRGG